MYSKCEMPFVEMPLFDRWFRCKISNKQKAEIERVEAMGGNWRPQQQVIQLRGEGRGTIPGPMHGAVGVRKGITYLTFSQRRGRGLDQPSHREVTRVW